MKIFILKTMLPKRAENIKLDIKEYINDEIQTNFSYFIFDLMYKFENHQNIHWN
jgi:hypothetical protein